MGQVVAVWRVGRLTVAAEEESLKVWLGRCWFTAAGPWLVTRRGVSEEGWVENDGGLAGVHSGVLCDPVLSARSIVKAFRIKVRPIPHLQNFCKQPSFFPPAHMHTHLLSLLWLQHWTLVRFSRKRHSNIPLPEYCQSKAIPSNSRHISVAQTKPRWKRLQCVCVCMCTCMSLYLLHSEGTKILILQAKWGLFWLPLSKECLIVKTWVSVWGENLVRVSLDG